jgi:adenine/guanine phosphoribosyltransferase-like PRPP-binding protein
MPKWDHKLPTNGHGLIEIYRTWEDSALYYEIVNELDRLVDNAAIEYDMVATITSTGTVFAAPFALHHSKGLIIIRKDKKVAHQGVLSSQYLNWQNQVESLFLDTQNLGKNCKVLFIDDIIQTGRSFEAARDLIQESENSIVAYAVVANLSKESEMAGIPILSVVARSECA